jgi:predicted DNA binding CopG/RHH family protein
MKKMILNNEEKDILDSYDQGEWRPVKNPKREIKKLQKYARNILHKDKNIK